MHWKRFQLMNILSGSFFPRFGQLSGMVEPVAGLLGAVAIVIAEPILPYALAFAAGAMIYVVVDDIIPEAQTWWVEKLIFIKKDNSVYLKDRKVRVVVLCFVEVLYSVFYLNMLMWSSENFGQNSNQAVNSNL